MLRGNAGNEIFFDESDRYYFYQLLEEGTDKFDHRIHSFCLMNNHVHLAVQVGTETLSKIIQNISFRYTRWFNNKQNRDGHLFQGRYKAMLVESESYFWELVRYIHLNPVRAGVVKDASKYRWSGHNAYLGDEEIAWLTKDWLLGQLAKRRSLARKRYAQFIQEGINEGYRKEFHNGFNDNRILGDDLFVERVLGGNITALKVELSLDELLERFCRIKDIQREDIVDGSRARRVSDLRSTFGWLANEMKLASLEELGSLLQRDSTTMCRAINKMKDKYRHDEQLKGQLDSLKHAIMQA